MAQHVEEGLIDATKWKFQQKKRNVFPENIKFHKPFTIILQQVPDNKPTLSCVHGQEKAMWKHTQTLNQSIKLIPFSIQLHSLYL